MRITIFPTSNENSESETIPLHRSENVERVTKRYEEYSKDF